VEGLRPIRERYGQLIADPAELERILAHGAERARAVAGPKIAQVKQAVGFLAAETA
jgi:tryptophanyl-tRNA synthetase